MNDQIKRVLDKIESFGFEAYVVGGYVRDYLLGIFSTDVDICTNALPKDIINIFEIKKSPIMYGSISFKIDKYNFDITTYRSEEDYSNRKPQVINYVNNLITDIERRDFTINSLCMNSSGQIIDLLSCEKDIDNKIIRVIGDTEKKLTEDPLRILRAVRFSITLGFELDSKIINFINKNKNLIDSLSFTRKMEELDKIFSSKNVQYGLNLLKELNLLDVLNINYDNIVVVSDLLGIWAQIDFSDKYQFTKSSLNTISLIRKIVLSGSVTNYNLLCDGLYVCMVAGQILGLSKEDINRRFNELKLKKVNDLCIKQIDIINILMCEPSSRIKLIYNDVLKKVLDCELDNNLEDIKNYILNNWK